MLPSDDTQIYLFIVSMKVRLRYDINVIYEYKTSTRLSLNNAKSKIQILDSNAYIKEIDAMIDALPRVYIRDIVVPYVFEAKNLVLSIISNISWNYQVSSSSRKVFLTLQKPTFHKKQPLYGT